MLRIWSICSCKDCIQTILLRANTIDESKTKVGYEIPFNRHFYVFKPPRALDEIDADLKDCTDRILTMIKGLSQ